MSRDVARQVLRIEAEAIQRLVDRLDERFDRAVEMVLKCPGRVVVSGMGKSGIVGRKIAATLASTGTPALFLHPADAVHGDLGMLVDGDVVLGLSNSGETAELVRLLEYVRRLGLGIVVFVGAAGSTLARHADIALDVSIDREACPLGLAPTASTTAALALGDALALAVADRRGFSAEDFARRHPGGRLGFRLRLVGDLMRTGDAVPRVDAGVALALAVNEMTRKGLGMTTIVDGDGRLVAVLTDGDLRRLVAQHVDVAATTAGEAARRGRRDRDLGPATIAAAEPASRGLAMLEERRITSLVVVDGEGRVHGVLHLNDLWRLELT